MAEITAQLVKELRDRTGAGMMECKSALNEANGDLAEAEVVLRKRGIASAVKKAARSTRQGLIGSFVDEGARVGVLVEVNCESDFVARTDDFQQLGASLARQIAATRPAVVRAEDGPGDALYAQRSLDEPGLTVEELIKTKIAKLGENISVARFVRQELAAPGREGVYIHHGGQLGVLLEMECGSAEAAAHEEFAELVHDLAMHVAAADPRFLSRQDVTTELLEKERAIQKARVIAEGKPEKVADKIVEGRLGKFFEEVCLLEQPFVKENTLTVEQLVKQKAAKLGAAMQITRFTRFKVGDTAPAD